MLPPEFTGFFVLPALSYSGSSLLRYQASLYLKRSKVAFLIPPHDPFTGIKPSKIVLEPSQKVKQYF